MVAIAAGSALCISADALLEKCRERPKLNSLLLLYVQSFVTQMGGTITSNLHDRLERRLARWLLMNHDRLDGDDIVLTHEQLGVMLGCRRATVTDALHVLEGEQLIYSLRGRVIIRDRCNLVAFAGGAYGMAEAAYGRLIAPMETLTN
jgi:CRP-like cAMP-binding protein